jgi:hypothetical protein
MLCYVNETYPTSKKDLVIIIIIIIIITITTTTITTTTNTTVLILLKEVTKFEVKNELNIC